MIIARRFIYVAIGFSLLVASACGGGGDELEKALQSLSEDDLAIMVLPQEAFGDASDGLEVASYSGVNDSDEVADDTLDPEDTGDDLEEAGFVTGGGFGKIDAGGGLAGSFFGFDQQVTRRGLDTVEKI